jgi:sugar O-acyltransferase (sialic acid O-acetyltransferase NeuD family)
VTQDLIVLGAGGSAGATVDLVEALNDSAPRWRIRGFLDDSPEKTGTSVFGIPVLGTIDTASSIGDAMFVIGVASYRRLYGRVDVAERANVPRERFVTLIHPLASVSPRASIGYGVLIFPLAVVCDGATVDNHAYLSSFCFVGHGASVGCGATMAPRSSLHGSSRLGRCAYAGSHSAIKELVSVGEAAIVGMGSVVMRDVDPRSTVVGNPARQLIRHKKPRE